MYGRYSRLTSALHPCFTMAISVSAVSVTTSDGSSKSLGDYAGKVLLIVNVASRCGFTKQYAGLQALNEAYAAKGLAVLGLSLIHI